jgi:hypothetical protein
LKVFAQNKKCKYNRVLASFLQKNKFVPCATLSFNLASVKAAALHNAALAFFGLVQRPF